MKLSLWLALLCTRVAAQPLQQVVNDLHNDPAFKGAAVAICVSEAGSGNELFSHNADQSLVPASTLKIFTTGAALQTLGRDFRFLTRIGFTGTFDQASGRINGDLVIAGSGDPTLNSSYFSEKNILRSWPELLRKAGVKEISGNVIGYAGSWERRVPDQWIWADIGNYFGSIPNGLSFSDNKYTIQLSSGEPGSAARVLSIHPQYVHTKITASASVTCKGSTDMAYIFGDPFGFEKIVTGTIPPRRGKFEIEGSLPDPALLCAEQIAVSLEAAGISCGGTPLSEYGAVPGGVQTLFVYNSPPLSEIVQRTNLHSNNHYCESLLLALGGGRADSGIAAVTHFWKSRCESGELIYMTDGSGLSRANTCTARLQCEALREIYRDTAVFETFDRSLPRAGMDGSMRSIGGGTYIENNMRAKTGYMERVRSYCGFVKSKSGRDLVFSVIVNNYNCSPAVARRKMEKILLHIAEL